jgi:hypothetical protein
MTHCHQPLPAGEQFTVDHFYAVVVAILFLTDR